ncbi:MAG: DUF2851 family protein [Verrucomicrobia bacterium]|nr:DUF2851 family protein [Verrucomicrobiota bacterium]
MRAHDEECLALYLRHVQGSDAGLLREEDETELGRRWSELEWQTLWYAGACGKTFRATSGAAVEILQFGLWNHEAGPDFIGAVIRVDGNPEPLHGDIELDLHVLDWEHHGHATNERFNRVVLHIFLEGSGLTFFTRTSNHREVLQVRLQAHLPAERPAPCPRARAQPGACCGPMRNLSPEAADAVLETAARVRLERKQQLLQRAIKVHGFEQALYQHIAMVLGYKENKLPFLLLSQRAPLASLRAEPATAEAVLFGLSGFLEKASLHAPSAAASGYVRSLWSTWWPRRGALHRLILPLEQWRFSSTRPSNHPQRRLAALASLASRWPELQSLPADLKTIGRFFASLSHPFWDFQYTLASVPLPRPMQLIGAARINDLLANVFIPMLSVAGHLDWDAVKRLPAKLSNARVRAMQQRLFGELAGSVSPPRYLYQEQGLLQLADDFCSANRHDCSRCGLPAYLDARATGVES